MSSKRIDTAGGGDLNQNPFGRLGGLDLPRQEQAPQQAAPKHAPQPRPKVRLEVRREKAGRGGKTVTLVRPLQPLPANDLQAITDFLKKRLATGGKIEGDRLAVQGDHVQTIVKLLADEGWNAFAAN